MLVVFGTSAISLLPTLLDLLVVLIDIECSKRKKTKQPTYGQPRRESIGSVDTSKQRRQRTCALANKQKIAHTSVMVWITCTARQNWQPWLIWTFIRSNWLHLCRGFVMARVAVERAAHAFLRPQHCEHCCRKAHKFNEVSHSCRLTVGSVTAFSFFLFLHICFSCLRLHSIDIHSPRWLVKMASMCMANRTDWTYLIKYVYAHRSVVVWYRRLSAPVQYTSTSPPQSHCTSMRCCKRKLYNRTNYFCDGTLCACSAAAAANRPTASWPDTVHAAHTHAGPIIEFSWAHAPVQPDHCTGCAQYLQRSDDKQFQGKKKFQKTNREWPRMESIWFCNTVISTHLFFFLFCYFSCRGVDHIYVYIYVGESSMGTIARRHNNFYLDILAMLLVRERSFWFAFYCNRNVKKMHQWPIVNVEN